MTILDAVKTSVTKVEIFSPYGQKLTVNVGLPQNGLFLKGFDGDKLDPTKSNIVTTTFSRSAGTQRQASRRESRDLKILLGFDMASAPGSIEKLRRSLHAFFMTGMEVVCRFYTGEGLVVDVRGEVEEFDSERGLVPDATISIFCFDPDFAEIAPLKLSSSTTFQPYFGQFTYKGSVDTGFKFTLNTNRTHESIVMTVIGANEVAQVLEFRYPLGGGDKLEISTISDAKGAWVTKSGGSRRSALQGVTPQSEWPTFRPGVNQIQIYTEGSGLPFSMDYTPKYGGI